jgi:peptidoglycan/xylan/chitin deacetylase (PgdA/CDA1 family)
MPGTILLGIDVETANECSETYARCGPEMLASEDVRATWYVTGKAMERYPDLFRQVDAGGLVDLQSHTYSHILLKTVLTEIPPGRTVCNTTGRWFLQRGGTNEQIDQDLARCQQVFQDVLGRKAVALCGPWNYYRGLGDRPDLLEIVHRHGFRILRTAGRNERDGLPVPMEWQPFFYEVQGFPDVLEILVHDYQDDYQFMEFNGLPDISGYAAHVRQVADCVARDNLVWGLCTHDHNCRTPEAFKEKTSWLVKLIRHAKSIGIRFLTATEYYRQMQAR